MATSSVPELRPKTLQFLNYIDSDILKELSHLDLSDEVKLDSKELIGGGGYSEVWKAESSFAGKSLKAVAIKQLRFHLKEDIKLLFEREIYVWAKLRHPNILPLLGFALDKSTGYPLLVSEWMQNGSAWNYVKSNLNRDLILLITGIAEGLEYLHNMGVVHMDIKSDNILINDAGVPLLCDFGCSRMLSASRTFMKVTSGANGTARYMAYELLTSGAKHSKESDVWAFGMTVFELLSGQRPFPNMTDFQVVGSITNGRLPTLPSHSDLLSRRSFEDKAILWDICQLCWNKSPPDRIDMSSILTRLRPLRDVTRSPLIFDTVTLSDGFFTGPNRVNCAAPFDYGRRVAYGTNDGVYFSDLRNPNRHPVRVLGIPDVTQIDVLEEFQLLIVLSEHCVITFPLEALSEHDPMGGLRRAKRISSHTSFFKAGMCLGKTLVCVVKSSQLSSTIKVLEAVDYAEEFRNKTTSYLKKLIQRSNNTLRLFREFYMPMESSSVHYLKTKLCVGCTKGFEIVDLETLDTQALLEPSDASLDFVQKREDDYPMAIYRIENDFLLCYDEFAFYVNRSGCRARDWFMVYWEGHPRSFALHYPYVLAFEPTFVEVRHVETGALTQVIQGNNLRCLFAEAPPSTTHSKANLYQSSVSNGYLAGHYGYDPRHDISAGLTLRSTRGPSIGFRRREIIMVSEDRVMSMVGGFDTSIRHNIGIVEDRPGLQVPQHDNLLGKPGRVELAAVRRLAQIAAARRLAQISAAPSLFDGSLSTRPLYAGWAQSDLATTGVDNGRETDLRRKSTKQNLSMVPPLAENESATDIES